MFFGADKGDAHFGPVLVLTDPRRKVLIARTGDRSQCSRDLALSPDACCQIVAAANRDRERRQRNVTRAMARAFQQQTPLAFDSDSGRLE